MFRKWRYARDFRTNGKCSNMNVSNRKYFLFYYCRHWFKKKRKHLWHICGWRRKAWRNQSWSSENLIQRQRQSLKGKKRFVFLWGNIRRVIMVHFMEGWVLWEKLKVIVRRPRIWLFFFLVKDCWPYTSHTFTVSVFFMLNLLSGGLLRTIIP